MPNLLGLVNAFYRNGNYGRSHPGGTDEEFQFKSITSRTNFELLSERQRITTKAALGIAEPQPRFNVEPECRNRVRATPSWRGACKVGIAYSNYKSGRLGVGCSNKLRKILCEMLAVGIHGDRMGKA